jgi:hypothetical protein
MPTTYYLRVEGVNIAHVLDDTRQLSVIRGGGLLLRQAVMDLRGKKEDLPNELKTLGLKAISTGASIGLFSFEADTPQSTVGTVVEYLRTHPHYRHLTFVVDIQEDSKNFQHDKEAVLARNRFRQMQQVTVAVSGKNENEKTGACALDNLRPAKRHAYLKKDLHRKVSVSVHERIKYGRKQKHLFYDGETGQDLKYTNDLQDLAALSDAQAKIPELKQLNNKIAVLYFDGNGFSGIQTRRCGTQEKQIAFDNYIQGERKGFLCCLLDCIALDSDFQIDKGALRLETLLWGGDEMIFVVPAWKGFEVLNFFYQHSAEWKFDGEKLTHASGLVFCSAKTPIQRVTHLAKELAENVKDSPDGRNCNLFDYMVLESIDFPTEPLGHTRKRQFGEEMTTARAPLVPFNDDMRKAAAWLKEFIPKGQAYACARAALADYEDDGTRQEEQATRLAEVSQIERNDIEANLTLLFPTAPDTRWQWLHLVDLWDYLV